MTFEFPGYRVLLFAKEPVPGQVKTRLQPAIGRENAYGLYCALLDYQAAMLEESSLCPWELWVSGNPASPRFTQLVTPHAIERQSGKDLGQRMYGAAQTVLAYAKAVILIGVDCPSIDQEYLRDAMQRLTDGNDVVIGPAEDGGYVLLGMRGSWPQLFDGVAWGTDQVFMQSIARLESLGLRYSVLPPRWDVDRVEDLARLKDLRPALVFELNRYTKSTSD